MKKKSVSYAFQLFSLDVEKRLYLYKEKNKQQYLNGETTTDFVNRIRNLITVMATRHLKNSLYLKHDNWKILVNF